MDLTTKGTKFFIIEILKKRKVHKALSLNIEIFILKPEILNLQSFILSVHHHKRTIYWSPNAVIQLGRVGVVCLC